MNLIDPTLVVIVGLGGFVICIVAAVVFAVIQFRHTSRVIRRARAISDETAEWPEGDHRYRAGATSTTSTGADGGSAVAALEAEMPLVPVVRHRERARPARR